MTIQLEKEVKFRLEPWDEGESLLESLGAEQTAAKTFETNALYDDASHARTARGEVLRVRHFGDTCWLTFKGPPHGSGRIKKRREFETSVDDGVALEAILDSLHFHSTFRYEKFRALYRWSKLAIMLDETPIGVFMELEGESESIESGARALAFSMDDALISSYPKLYERYRDENPDAPKDMIFRK